MPAAVAPIGQPVNDEERRAIAYLRDHLPAGYTLLHNFELQQNDELFEVDLAVLAPHAVFLIDIKGTQGAIEVHGAKWYPQGRPPFASPVPKLRAHAKTLKGILSDSQPGRYDVGQLYVDALVVLTARTAQLIDPAGRDSADVVQLADAPALLQNVARVPARFSRSIAPLHNIVRAAIQGKARPRSGPLVLGNWRVVQRLGATDHYTEYRAENIFAGASAGAVLLRVYQADPYLPPDERAEQRFRIANAYRTLSRLPPHPNIVPVRDFFATENEDGYVYVTEEVSGQALRLHIDKPSLALTLDQKLRVAGELLAALDHAHQHGVIHRNLTPAAVLVGSDGHLRLVNFDFARGGADRTRTFGEQIVDAVEPAYMAPEVALDPLHAGAPADLFSAGVLLYELFTGVKPFQSMTEVVDQAGRFGEPPSHVRSDLPAGLDDWLQALCAFEPAQRPSAAEAAASLAAIANGRSDNRSGRAVTPPAITDDAIDYTRLKPGHPLTPKFVIEKRLGKPGAFGVVYKAIDTLGDVPRAVKLILRDRHSTVERLKTEYRTLLNIPPHPHVVRVIDADLLQPANVPMIIFEYVEGADVRELVDAGAFTPEDALSLGRDTAAGLAHLHAAGFHHCDIKPSNLLWTRQGVRIIDFNVAVRGEDGGHGGGSRRYLPPDLDLEGPAQSADLVDRDLYALGVTLYEAIAGRYPWGDLPTPPPGVAARPLTELSGLHDLAPEFAEVVHKAIAPRRAERFTSAEELGGALGRVRSVRRPVASSAPPATVQLQPLRPNTNPFVEQLLTFYSQSQRTNAGTRGLDSAALQTYVPTLLDRELLPAVLAGEFRLVVITGNAGDGKTAFLQTLEEEARRRGAAFDAPRANGARFVLGGRVYVTNYDGSQDEDAIDNDTVLRAFFGAFQGADIAAWPHNDTNLIAINEGRLVDFLASHRERYGHLGRLVEDGLHSGAASDGVAVVNLNLRSVVAATHDGAPSIFAQLLRAMTAPANWAACQACDLKARCYVHHNVQTFQDPQVGPKVAERLETLHTLVHLRGEKHTTVRMLRSALAFTLAGTRTCDEIHELYTRGQRTAIVQGFYFNSWLGGDALTSDPLLEQLQALDVGRVVDPQLDRMLSFTSPAAGADSRSERLLFTFAERGDYDRGLLRKLFEELPDNSNGGPERAAAHQAYLAMLRRRTFFERRDAGWAQMLSYRSADRLLALIRDGETLDEVLQGLLHALNRGEGLTRPAMLGNRLAIRVRHVEKGTIRSYRLFPAERFTLVRDDGAARARFVEHLPGGLILRYRGPNRVEADLRINLDVFELLERLNAGYRPSVEDEQGVYGQLAIFKNILGSEPYQEVLLTTMGHDFYRIERAADGVLSISQPETV